MSLSPGHDLPVRLQQHDFLHLIRELEVRSQHRREAGAFLLAPLHEGRADLPVSGCAVIEVAYYDDLDPTCLTGGITFDADGYGRLNELCRDHQVRVVADIHLHPGAGIRQSKIDSAHPMVARSGHLALIAPSYGRGVVRTHQLGAHVKTTDGWRAFLGDEVADVLAVRPTWRGRLMQLKMRLDAHLGRRRTRSQR